MKRAFKDNQNWLNRMAGEYPYAAVSCTAPEVSRQLRQTSISRITNKGVRMWRFKTEALRRAFLEEVETAEPAGV